MERRITVKGTGQVSIKPDLVVLELRLDSLDMNYETAMELATRSMAEINDLLATVGFKKEELKTTNFNVNTQYRSEQDKQGQYIQIFEGYLVHHDLKLEFDFDQTRLTRTLAVIASGTVMPKLEIQFSVKDKTEVSEALLFKATENAKSKAVALAKASGVALGELLLIDYNWGELHLYSRTMYSNEDSMMMKSASFAPDIEPEDITLNDNVTFVWALE